MFRNEVLPAFSGLKYQVIVWHWCGLVNYVILLYGIAAYITEELPKSLYCQTWTKYFNLEKKRGPSPRFFFSPAILRFVTVNKSRNPTEGDFRFWLCEHSCKCELT